LPEDVAFTNSGERTVRIFKVSGNIVRLAMFIRGHIEEISAEWENFAATLVPGEGFSESILRDDIVDILNGIATDMDRAENAEEASEEVTKPSPRPMEEAAGRHARSRLEMGMSSRQLIAEFRALRATVIRLWQSSPINFDKTSLYDMTRFNAAVDRVLSDATVMYTEALDRSRDTFLGILGHDLRNPLAAISGAAELQLRGATNERHAHFASQILVSAGRMSHLITDMPRLGKGTGSWPGTVAARSGRCIGGVRGPIVARLSIAGCRSDATIHDYLTDSRLCLTARFTRSGKWTPYRNAIRPRA
jgi:hypothetical protein